MVSFHGVKLEINFVCSFHFFKHNKLIFLFFFHFQKMLYTIVDPCQIFQVQTMKLEAGVEVFSFDEVLSEQEERKPLSMDEVESQGGLSRARCLGRGGSGWDGRGGRG